MKKALAAIAVLGILGAGALFIKHAIAAPARATARNLVAINRLTVGTTTEAELLARKEFTALSVRDGLVTGASVFISKAGLPGIWLRQVLEMPPGCLSNPCVRRNMYPNQVLIGITISFSNDSNVCNHIPEAVNSDCLARLHGCSTYADLVPITKELNLEATGR